MLLFILQRINLKVTEVRFQRIRLHKQRNISISFTYFRYYCYFYQFQKLYFVIVILHFDFAGVVQIDIRMAMVIQLSLFLLLSMIHIGKLIFCLKLISYFHGIKYSTLNSIILLIYVAIFRMFPSMLL